MKGRSRETLSTDPPTHPPTHPLTHIDAMIAAGGEGGGVGGGGGGGGRGGGVTTNARISKFGVGAIHAGFFIGSKILMVVLQLVITS